MNVSVHACSVVSHSATPWSPPGFSVHRIFQARILEWVAFFYSRVIPIFHREEALNKQCITIGVLRNKTSLSTVTVQQKPVEGFSANPKWSNSFKANGEATKPADLCIAVMSALCQRRNESYRITTTLWLWSLVYFLRSCFILLLTRPLGI